MLVSVAETHCKLLLSPASEEHQHLVFGIVQLILVRCIDKKCPPSVLLVLSPFLSLSILTSLHPHLSSPILYTVFHCLYSYWYNERVKNQGVV